MAAEQQGICEVHHGALVETVKSDSQCLTSPTETHGPQYESQPSTVLSGGFYNYGWGRKQKLCRFKESK